MSGHTSWNDVNPLRVAQRRARDLEDELERQFTTWSEHTAELQAQIEHLTEELTHLRREYDSMVGFAGTQSRRFRDEVGMHVRCHLLALRLARLGDASDPTGVADRVKVTLNDLVTQAVAALHQEAP